MHSCRPVAHPRDTGEQPQSAATSLLRPWCPYLRRLRWRPGGAALIGLAASALFATGTASAQPLPTTTARLTPPEPTLTVKASYPPDALAAGKEGSVTVLVTIGKDGVVRASEIFESSGDRALDQAATDAVLQWRFKPAMQDGVPIESQVRVPFHFHLAEHGPGEHALPSPSPVPVKPPPPAPLSTNRSPSPEPAAPEVASGTNVPSYESSVRGKNQPPSRGTSDYHVDVEKLSFVPHANAAEFLKLAPGILLTNEGGEGHAEQVFLRGFDAKEGQDIEFSVDGVPINESGNLHGNGYSDTHFIIPELVESLRIVEGPFDPRQGNYAVAGSAEYHLGIGNRLDRGLSGKFTVGSFGTYRMLLTWAPPGGNGGTFAAAEYYQTAGYGQNRDGRRGSVIGQWEGKLGSADVRVTAQAYISSFHTAGVIREDDYQAGRIGFYGSYDTQQHAAVPQGEDASRYSVAADFSGRTGNIFLTNQFFGIARPLRLRENFTGFLEDTQQPLQDPHGQRGDEIDLNVMEWTAGARGSARLVGTLFKQIQELEIGYFARGDFVSSSQQRLEASTGHAYQTDTSLDSRLGDVGLYADANLRFLRWLSLRGGARGDLFTYDVNNLCAVPITSGTVEHPTTTRPLYDQSCLDEENMGAHREPNQRASTSSGAIMPRGSLLVGPFYGISGSASAGTGVRSVDPQYVTQDDKTPFAHITAYEGGLSFNRRFRDSMDLSLRSVVFYTHVDHDLIFDQTVGRNTLANGTTRLGSASSARFTGPFWDLAANLTYVKATFDDTHLLVPYVPDLVFRFDGALYGELPWWHKKLRGHPLFAALGAGITYVGPRPLPFGERSDTIFTVDASLTIRWWFITLGLTGQNLLDTKYKLGEYNYASDFHSQPFPTLVPERLFTAGAPLTLMFSMALTYGGAR